MSERSKEEEERWIEEFVAHLLSFGDNVVCKDNVVNTQPEPVYEILVTRESVCQYYWHVYKDDDRIMVSPVYYFTRRAARRAASRYLRGLVGENPTWTYEWKP